MSNNLKGSTFRLSLKEKRERIINNASAKHCKPISLNKIKYTSLAGIYKIECTETNSVYIGQSLSVETRLLNHKRALKIGKHPINSLQQDYKLYGDSCFLFETIYETDDQDLLTLETYYIQEYLAAGYNLYNTVLCTDNIGMVQCNKIHKDILQKISDMLDSGKIKKEELEQALFYKQNSW